MIEFRFNGVITSTGKLAISYQDEFTAFCKKHPGTSYVCILRVFEPKASEAIKGYYFNKVVPDFQRAFKQAGERLNILEVEERLRSMSPVMRSEGFDRDGNYVHELKSARECSSAELAEHIEHLKQIAAEEFSFYIQDANEYGGQV